MRGDEMRALLLDQGGFGVVRTRARRSWPGDGYAEQEKRGEQQDEDGPVPRRGSGGSSRHLETSLPCL